MAVHQLQNTRQLQVIFPTGELSGWVDARKETRDKGGLPPNALLSKVFMRPRDWKVLGQCHVIWTRDVLVYPASGEKFKRGSDVVGGFGLVGPANSDNLKGGRWVFPASCIPPGGI